MATRDFVKDGEKATTACTLRLMRCLAGQGVILHGDSWFASLNTLLKLREQGIYFAGLIKTGHSGIPVKYLRGLFTAQSPRGETKTVHLGDGITRVFAHAWNEPGWKNGKPPKKAQKVWVSNCYSAAPVEPWDKNRTFLSADGMVRRGVISVPQSLLIREYYGVANRIDIHSQYRQGLLAIERTWKTKSWQLRLFQTVMGMVLVNGYLAYKFLTPHNPTLREFTNRVALAMCAVQEDGAEVDVSSGTRLARQRAGGVRASVSDPGGLGHRLFSARTLGLGGEGAEGSCKLCTNKHACGVCKNVLQRPWHRETEAVLDMYAWKTWQAMLLPAYA